ncbi:CocE/NonD family hydrolase [Solitalea koreensis]|uniref:Xaa-Pro dipeptidyl-peptidase C-terminal domain-containing protein n=1 Tax=Solitalea koreensis TaxID=543615 RepID=A0A521AAX4_9SPHI|nr:CocE/NonD family hydrolase [Solitalea koreensis]SMO31947.1 hypothetical protein SAMN06265350_10121 [Solitalea koreensis]
MKHPLLALLFLFLFTIPKQLFAQQDSAYIRDNYVKHEYQIQMRDGAKLFTAVYAPKDQSKKYPFMMIRTPYNVGPYGEHQYRKVLGPSSDFIHEGFIFVYQDVRGRFMSTGDFVNVRPHHPQKKGKEIDESSDTYDTVDWLLKNVPNNNGKVGVWGISYPGFYSVTAAISGHPAIKAVSPQAPVTNWFLGDDFHHNGAFMMMDYFNFYTVMGVPRPNLTTEWPASFDYKSSDNYSFYLNLGALPDIEKKMFKGNVAYWNDFLQHPNYDDYWKARDIRQFMKGIKPATLVVGGLFDAEDCWGAFETYKSIEKQNPNAKNTLVEGPWFHGGWARSKGNYFGDIKFGSETGTWYQKNIEFPFFMYYLKGVGKDPRPEALMFDVGADKWKEFASWPPKEVKEKNIYFQANQKLLFDKPLLAAGFDEYISDPKHPVPYQDEISMERTREYMIDDQRFASRRPDVLVYQTGALTEDITLAGPIWADLFVSTTGTDADFVVKVIDVYPDSLKSYTLNGKDVKIGGYQMLLRGEVMRGRYRKSFEKPEAFTPGKVEEVKFSMPDVMHTFRKGHKIMVQVQSSWFPLVDRNPQKYIENIYKSQEGDFQKATHRVYFDVEHPSSIKVSVLEKE